MGVGVAATVVVGVKHITRPPSPSGSRTPRTARRPLSAVPPSPSTHTAPYNTAAAAAAKVPALVIDTTPLASIFPHVPEIPYFADSPHKDKKR